MVARDRPIALERYTDAVRWFLLDQHILVGDMLRDGEPMFIWTRGATVANGDPIAIRRYAYVPEEFRRRTEAMGRRGCGPWLGRSMRAVRSMNS